MAAGIEVPKRRLESLRLLERLRRQDIESRTIELTRLRGEMAVLEDEKRDLLRRLAEETHVTSLEAAAYLPQFIRSVRERIATLDAKATALRPKLEAVEDAVRALFLEKRTYEVLRQRGEASNKALMLEREAEEAADLMLQRWASGG